MKITTSAAPTPHIFRTVDAFCPSCGDHYKNIW